MPSLLRTLFAPVLLVQGKRMFATMPMLPEPEGDANGMRGDGPLLRLLIVGDSSAAGYGVATRKEALQGQITSRLAGTHTVCWTTFARFGSTGLKTLRFIEKQETASYDVAVVAVGLNDMISGELLRPWLDAQRQLVKTLRDRFRVSHIVISGLPPIGGFPALPQPMRWILGRQRDRYDAALQAWITNDPALTYIPTGFTDDSPLQEGDMTVADVMSTDGFHPGPLVYEEWGQRAAEAIRARPLPS
ncbi:MAG: SGNH/GDSL hydrolase family protein [Rubricoccaceae bacterium]